MINNSMKHLISIIEICGLSALEQFPIKKSQAFTIFVYVMKDWHSCSM